MTEVFVDKTGVMEAEGLVEKFLAGMTVDEEKELLAFMQGVRLAKWIAGSEKSGLTA